MSADKAQPDQAPTSGQAHTPEDENKRRFREALEAKKGRRGEDHIDDGPQHVHAHGPVETKFERNLKFLGQQPKVAVRRYLYLENTMTPHS